MQKTGLMAVCTQMGKGVVSEDNPGYIGCTALSDNDLVHVAIKNADLIINVGHDISEKPPFIMEHNKPPLVIHLNFTRPNVDPVYFPHLVMVGYEQQGASRGLLHVRENLPKSEYSQAIDLCM